MAVRTAITRFLGINEGAAGETVLSPGESPYMRNFRIIDRYKLKKREGWKHYSYWTKLTGKKIRGMWRGELAGTEYFVVAANSKLYKIDETAEDPTPYVSQIGAVADADVCFFRFDNELYILDGTSYQVFNGSTVSAVTGYVPTVMTATSPAGAGTVLENVNLLTGTKKQYFSGDGVSTDYYLIETDIDSVDEVEVNDQVITTGYTVDKTTGIIAFDNPPSDAENNVLITWTKADADGANLIKKMRGACVSGGADTRVFLFGNPDVPNYVYYSGLADGVPSAAYFPALSFNVVGDGAPITDIVRQYDRNIIFTNKEAWYSPWELQQDSSTGVYYTSFPVFPLNSGRGCTLFRGAVVLDNNPVTITPAGIYEWVATNVRDERNATYISDRVKSTLAEREGMEVCAVDVERRGEYWLTFSDGIAVIYNYRYDVWYIFDDIPARVFMVYDGVLYFGTDDGDICLFDDEQLNDDGNAYTARWDMAFSSFQENSRLKNVLRVYVNIKPEARSYVEGYWWTDYSKAVTPFVCQYNLFNYSAIDYSDWSYDANDSDRTFRVRVMRNRPNFFKVSLINDKPYNECTLTALEFELEYTREVKFRGNR